MEYNWPVGPPKCKPVGNGIFEIRSDISGGRTGRILFFIDSGELYLLHGFIKKSRKTPKQDIDLANRRKEKMEN